jgi:hypothetical protein
MQLPIEPDHHYRIAGRDMTGQEIQERIRDDERFAARRLARRCNRSKPA